MARRVTVLLLSAIALILIGKGTDLPLVGEAQALHNCGERHGHAYGDDDGYHGGDDDERRGNRGCRTLDVNDFFYGDPRPDAPELAYRGPYNVGVRTIEVVNPDQIDILNITPENPEPRYDRPLKLEIWYPAKLRKRQREVTSYKDHLGTGPGVPDRPVTPFRFGGRAARGARPDRGDGPYPLLIVSHGYPGSRVLLSNLTENLASKGYIVVAIDHTESTHADKVGFGSTLLNRALDIHFVLNTIADMSHFGIRRFLTGMVDDENTAVIGYSMGGYGALIAAGAGLTEAFVSNPFGSPSAPFARLQSGNPDYLDLLDDRIKALVLFAPFGGSFGLWDQQTLLGLTVPSFFIVGEQDRTAPFAGVDFLAQNAVNSDRYYLKYQGAIHEVPVNPAPPISESNYAEWLHYQEPAWDNRKLNNINQHFVTAFLGLHLLGQPDIYEPFLNLLEPFSNESPRSDVDDPRYWKGFTAFGAIGMELRHLPAAP